MKFKELSKLSAGENEKQIAAYWADINIIHKTTDNRRGCENWVFYEGPPTANGKPGIHHIIARTLKDGVNKYKAMKGYRVVKKAGWDTHGLPVEIEVEKSLGMKGKQDIEKYGIEEFNKKCRESVFAYEALWREMTAKMAYFVDMDDPYITLDNNYIESVWWILDKYFKDGLIYEGHKILPYCPRCGTGLASHEVAQGYENITSDTLIVKFKAKDADEYFLVWTTTPWTLASNVALAVGADIDYVRAKKDGAVYILAKERAEAALGSDYEIIDTFKGVELEGREYEQLMEFLDPGQGNSFTVALGDFVSVEDGTGIVHIAPAFGEDDYNLSKKYGLAVINPVNERGEYTATPWAGRNVMEADKDIIIWLKENHKLFKKERMEHNYPHCWRCKTPLIYYAKPSWYIEVTKYKDKLIAANDAVLWYPDFVGEKRFGNWLENLKDWSISRNRYWGTPLNIWRCECGHTLSVGSRKELIEKAVEDIDETIEMHRPYIDEVHIKCPCCGGLMSRVADVIDCWFDSGSMPFAQYHYPFENEEIFKDQFPADFICEGIDQTRGWFYSLIAIGTYLSGHSPYRRVLVNDLILDKEGRKMSKSRGNTVDPFAMFDKYGADALRWYLLYVSPAWTPTKFDEEGLKEVISKFFNTFRNVYSFFAIYANADGIDPTGFDIPVENRDEIDRWLISKYNSLVKDVTDNMEAFDMTKSVRAIQEFVNEDLSNWYIRRSRRRFWESGLTEDKKSVFLTTYETLLGVAKLSAPFAPYIAEEIYMNLTGLESVHLADYPVSEEKYIDKKLERKMDLVRSLVRLGRSAREEAGIKVRQPISEIVIDAAHMETIGNLDELIKEELNVKSVNYENDLNKYMEFALKPDYKTAGKVFGPDVKALAKYLGEADAPKLLSRLEGGEAVISLPDGKMLKVSKEHLDIRISAKAGFNVQTQDNLFAILNTELTPGLINEGYAREAVSKIQQMRKNSGFDVSDRIDLFIASDEDIINAVREYEDFISLEVLARSVNYKEEAGEKVNLNGHDAVIKIQKAH